MERLAGHLADTGIVLLDMPITRGEPAAEAGQLLVMVGGDTQAFEACKPALAKASPAVFFTSVDLGAGQVGKMVNNLILWSCISANFEGFKLAAALGVDLDRLRTALIDSSASNWALQTRPDRIPMPWAEKDMRIVLSEADRLRLSRSALRRGYRGGQERQDRARLADAGAARDVIGFSTSAL